MAQTLPRWEYRIFGPDLSALEAKIGPAAKVPLHRSEDLYLTHERSPHNAKIREAALDVKRLKTAAPNGLELWEVAMKRGFPMAEADVVSFFEALDVAPPTLRNSSYALEEFLSDIIGRDPSFRVISVKKSRQSFRFGERLAEFVRLDAGGALYESFCIEDESPERVLDTLGELGLDPAANVNYPKFLKSLSRPNAVSSPRGADQS